ncbi:hypothetical protein [Roseibium salinum]|uniref:Uncharacterized protein n=1 Tax=Roseibium salinum TaxID=1604349 RepID=A0ABT3R9L1_9HYPH|nr:hypothetical protein [Roseibium sp. DSM 29163]MCX2725746.1 hypothetical protein [Roseibium sp. DSM 29163]MDN3720508.1 hypothetical protein [Roseibium salinum]
MCVNVQAGDRQVNKGARPSPRTAGEAPGRFPVPVDAIVAVRLRGVEAKVP